MTALKIRTEEAALLMGCSPQFVRVGMQSKQINIGDAIKMSSVWTYNISPALLADRQGMSIDELYEVVRQIRGEKGKADNG